MDPAKPRRSVPRPIVAASVYFVGSCIWVVLTDRELVHLSADPNVIYFWSTLKGIIYVVATTGIVYILLRRLSDANRDLAKRAGEALRQSEVKYKSLFENATYGIFVSQTDGTLLDVNPALVTMLGYGSREELLTRNLTRDVYEDPAVRAAILARYGPDERVYDVEAKWRRKDGKIIAVLINGGAVRQENGAISHFEVMVQDITERRSLEEQFRQSQRMEAVGLLAGGIAHDFNNLLGVILGNAELLIETKQSGTQQHYAKRVKEAAGSAAQLIRQLLAFSRKQVLYPTVLNLNAVVRDVGKIVQRLIGEDVRIVVEPDPSLGSVRADRGQIEQILMNLSTNARDAMPEGGVITFRTGNAEFGPDDVARHSYAKPGQYIRLSVSDTGVGMSEEIQAHVFEPFFTTKPQARGTGLGLATVYGIVKQSDGYIWISSAPGAGTTFDIYLPRVPETASPLVREVQAEKKYLRGTETIMLLEDEDSLRQVIREFLTGSGYKVLEAGRGDMAVGLAEQYKESIHLIISDVVLPDMTGPSVVAKLQALHPEMRALYVSGYLELPMAQELTATGAILVQKPMTRTDLLAKVDQILHPPTSLGE